MHDLTDHRSASRAVGAAAALSLLLVAAGPAWPQGTPPALGVQSPAPQSVPNPPPPQQQPQAEPAPPAREENPGLINELGKLWDKSISVLPKIKSPSETLDDLTNMAKPSTMVSGRMACAVSPNGAPDCKTGADRLCQSKGYKEGKSLDTDAAEKCSPKAYIPGRRREPGDCKTENFVIKALCQ
ncbi:hypothetical protein [Bradyrhizobium sp.]|uniref:hypothetical protein n=1 Tax=Bradyrhizobium sp. TaxID=376 RepID=UPI001DB070B1|nr:hypothetical protein [Bradyrhizobium sp.]MBI5318600.1 hypothetical protein [Bradyrhizobium sp.]